MHYLTYSCLFHQDNTNTVYILDFKYILYDFSPDSDQKVKGELDLILFLLLLKYIFLNTDDFKVEFIKIVKLSEEDITTEYFELLIRYILNARDDISAKELNEIAKQVSSERGEEIMTIAEKLRMEGREEGIKEGKIEIAENLLRMGIEIDQIIKATKLEKEKIIELKNKIYH